MLDERMISLYIMLLNASVLELTIIVFSSKFHQELYSLLPKSSQVNHPYKSPLR